MQKPTSRKQAGALNPLLNLVQGRLKKKQNNSKSYKKLFFLKREKLQTKISPITSNCNYFGISL